LKGFLSSAGVFKHIVTWLLIVGLSVVSIVVVYYIFYGLALGLPAEQFLVFTGACVGGAATFGGVYFTHKVQAKGQKDEFKAMHERLKKEKWLEKLESIVWDTLDYLCVSKASNKTIEQRTRIYYAINNKLKLFFGTDYILKHGNSQNTYKNHTNQNSPPNVFFTNLNTLTKLYLQSGGERDIMFEEYIRLYNNFIDIAHNFLEYHKDKALDDISLEPN